MQQVYATVTIFFSIYSEMDKVTTKILKGKNGLETMLKFKCFQTLNLSVSKFSWLRTFEIVSMISCYEIILNNIRKKIKLIFLNVI